MYPERMTITNMGAEMGATSSKSIARIHKGNLINHGIVPMLFEDPADYEKIELGDELEILHFLEEIPTRRVTVTDKTKKFSFTAKLDLSDAQIEVVLAGGQLRYLKQELVKEGILEAEA